LECLDDIEMCRALEHSPGLCLPHLRQALAVIGKNREQRHYVLNLHREKWLKLESEVKEFIRKSDYHCQGEPFGSERDSWLRTVKQVTGKDGQ